MRRAMRADSGASFGGAPGAIGARVSGVLEDTHASGAPRHARRPKALS